MKKLKTTALLLCLASAAFSCNDNPAAPTPPVAQPGTSLDRCDEACSRARTCASNQPGELDPNIVGTFCSDSCHHINRDLARPEGTRAYFSCLLDQDPAAICNPASDTACSDQASSQLGDRDIDRTFNSRCMAHASCGYNSDICNDSTIFKDTIVQSLNSCLDRTDCAAISTCIQGVLGS